jgi:hypothetical protein
VEYPKFKEVWWAYRRTYHAHVRDELACRALKDKILSDKARAVVGDIEDLDEVWDTLDTCYTTLRSTSWRRWIRSSSSESKCLMSMRIYQQ